MIVLAHTFIFLDALERRADKKPNLYISEYH